MAKEELYIANQLVDLPVGGITFVATYSIADISTIDKRSSSITKTLTLPATPRNQKIFGFTDQLSSTSGIDQTVITDARIDKEGVTVLSGIFKITDVEMNDTNSVSAYKGVIIGDNGAWKIPIKDLKLSDIDLSDQDHTYDAATITASETLSDSRDYVYPLINYGVWLGGATVNIEDRFPAVRIKRVIEQIYNDQGFKINSEFLNSDFGKRLFMPFTNNLTASVDTFADDKLFRVRQEFSQFLAPPLRTQFLDITDETSAGFFDPNGLIDLSTNEFTPLQNSVQNIKATVQIASTGGVFSLEIQQKKVGVSGFQQIASTEYTASNTDQQEVTVETGFIIVDALDRYRVVLRLTGNQLGSSLPAQATVFDGVFSNDVSLQVARDSEVLLSSQLPDWFQIDIIQAIKTEFNLYFDTDTETRTVTIEPFDDFFIDETVDWSDRLDLNSKRIFKYVGSNQSKTIIFDYSDDSNDKPVQQILDRDLEFAEHVAISTNVFARDGSTPVKTAFSPTLMATASSIGFTSSLLPKMWNDLPLDGLPDKSTDFSPRILYYAGVESMSSGESWTFEGAVRTDYPRMLFYDEVNDNDINLMFKTLRRSHGLFEKFYRNSQKILNEGRVFIGMFNLNDNDISNLNFRKRITLTLNGEFHTFILNKVINYDGERLTKVELITDVGTTKLTQVTTEADDPNILPPDFQPIPDPTTAGIVATVNGVTVNVLSTDPATGGTFWVQTAATQQGTNGR